MTTDIETIARYTAKTENEARAIFRMEHEHTNFFLHASIQKDNPTEENTTKMHIALGRYYLACDLAREAGATADLDLVARRTTLELLIEWAGGHAVWSRDTATFEEGMEWDTADFYDPKWTRLFDVTDPTDGPYPY